MTNFAFLTNRPLNPDLVRAKSAISTGMVARCVEPDKLRRHLAYYAHRENRKSIDPDRFRAEVEELLDRMERLMSLHAVET